MLVSQDLSESRGKFSAADARGVFGLAKLTMGQHWGSSSSVGNGGPSFSRLGALSAYRLDGNNLGLVSNKGSRASAG